MSLFSAMMASVSGMQGQATMLSTISDNIANSGTTGYKEATTAFESLLSQASPTSYTAGGVGTNIGYSISKQGELTSASQASDMAINGNGFFIVQGSGGSTYLTRAGDFSVNSSGNLVNSEGYTLLGYPASATSMPGSVSQLTPIQISTAGMSATASTSGTLTANVDSSATAQTINLPSANTASSTYTSMTSITAYDNLGTPVTLNVYYTKTGTNTWEMDVYNAADATSGGFPYSSGPLSSLNLTFSSTTGDLTSATNVVGGATVSTSAVPIAVPNGQTLNLNISGMTQLDSSFGVSDNTINGNAPGSYSGISISTSGVVSEVYSNGTSQAVATIPLGTVAAVNNLTPTTGQAYSINANTGNIILGNANSNGFGTINSNELESSTVDLATQLTNMVVSQNAYSANSKAFQTGADMLTTLINMLK